LLAEHAAGYLQSENLEVDICRLESRETGSFVKNCMYAFRKKQVKLESLPQVADSEIVLLGSPVWAFDIAPAMRTFIVNTDLSGKKVFAFLTYGSGRGKDRAMDAFCKLAEEKGAVIIGRADARGRKVNEEFPHFRGVLEQCLRKLQLKKPRGQ